MIRRNNAEWLAGVQKIAHVKMLAVPCIWSNEKGNAITFDSIDDARAVCTQIGGGVIVSSKGNETVIKYGVKIRNAFRKLRSKRSKITEEQFLHLCWMISEGRIDDAMGELQ